MLYGGITVEASQMIEVFDLIGEEIIRTIPYDTGSLNVRDYASIAYNDLLIIIGGIRIESLGVVEDSFQYFNLSELLEPMEITAEHKIEASLRIIQVI